MRVGCQYVLHSTSQLYPHKRKHEKREVVNSSSNAAATARYGLEAALGQQRSAEVERDAQGEEPPTLTTGKKVLPPAQSSTSQQLFCSRSFHGLNREWNL